MRPRPIALIGPMGSGKSAVGAELAALLGWPLVDLDAEIEARAGLSIAPLFAERGEAAFRALESDLLREAVARGACVIATGGGVILDGANRDCLQQATTAVWLRVTPAVRRARLLDERATRPLLHGGDLDERIATLDAQRTPLYASSARQVVDADVGTPHEIAAYVLKVLRDEEAA